MTLAAALLRQPVLDRASKQTPIRRECLVWLQFFDRINRGNGLVRARGMGRTHAVIAAALRRLTRMCAQITGAARMTTEDYVLQTRIFVLRILLRIWQAQKHTFGQHLPGKNAFAPLAQLAEQLTLNSKLLFWSVFSCFDLAWTSWDKSDG